MALTQAETKKTRSLQTKKGRRATGAYPAEGVRLLEESLRLGALPIIVYAAMSLLSERGRRLVERFGEAGVKVRPVSAREMERIAGTTTSPGVLGVFDTPEVVLDKLWLPSARTILLCEHVSDPGNLGTLARSALAFDIDLMILADNCAEPFAPKAVRSSMGALFALPVAESTTKDVLAQIRQRDAVLIAADVQGSEDMAAVLARHEQETIVLAIGSEADGLSEMTLKTAQEHIRIAHSTQVESLNAAVAGSICMNEMYRYRNRRRK